MSTTATTTLLPVPAVTEPAHTYRGRPTGAPTEVRGPRVRLYVSGVPTACQPGSGYDSEMWFAKDPAGRAQAMEACRACPFRGRCSYNAVAVRATHGIWGGIDLPGDRARRLVSAYARLLEQFEARRAAEIGDAPFTPLAADEHFLRRRDPAA